MPGAGGVADEAARWQYTFSAARGRPVQGRGLRREETTRPARWADCLYWQRKGLLRAGAGWISDLRLLAMFGAKLPWTLKGLDQETSQPRPIVQHRTTHSTTVPDRANHPCTTAFALGSQLAHILCGMSVVMDR